jgi:hypothetical protein
MFCNTFLNSGSPEKRTIAKVSVFNVFNNPVFYFFDILKSGSAAVKGIIPSSRVAHLPL